MRDLVFKNLTSTDKRRKVISSCEIAERQGVRSVIRRHFICLISEAEDAAEQTTHPPSLYIKKERNDKEQREKFFCRVKGCVYAIMQGRVFRIDFVHSLKICLVAVPDVAIY